MSPRVDFEHEFQYRDFGHDSVFPALDVTLIGPSGEEDLIAILDTGAKYSLFSGVRAAPIGLDLTTGRREILSGLAGQLIAWIHQVDLEISFALFGELANRLGYINAEICRRLMMARADVILSA